MSPRELIIFLLGLAIVGVLLRGLSVALKARRQQVRLAIDKNLPRDFDLDELEMAELPSGGARVVSREQEAREAAEASLARARIRAEAKSLRNDQEQSIPVLMDAVSVTDPGPRPGAPAPDDTVFAEKDYSRQPARSSSMEREAAHFAVAEAAEAEDPAGYPREASDPDEVLFDYDTGSSPGAAEDGLSAVTPDYPEYSSAPRYLEADGTAEADLPAELPDDAADPLGLDEEETAARTLSAETTARREPSFDPNASFEDSLDEFSMTAGERIGQEQPKGRKKKPAPVAELQPTLFDDLDLPEEAREDTPAPKPKSLLAKFGKLKPVARRSVQPDPDPEENAAESASVPAADQESPATPTAPSSSTRDAVVPHSRAKRQEPVEPAPPPPRTQPVEVLVVNLMAREGRVFHGDVLLGALLTAGLKFGDMSIFHKRLGVEGKGPTLFSVANSLNPGTFDLNNISEFTTVGISLFLALPTPTNNLDAFEQLLTTARQLQSQLDGELKDDHRNVLTKQTIEHYRQRIRDFELRQLKAAGGRG